MSHSRPRVLVVNTGGTIGMKKTAGGYAPARGQLPRLLAKTLGPGGEGLPDFDVEEFEPLLDSSDMTPADWLTIADAVRRSHARYDGFLVLHGTDTMAYTASALSFMLEGLRKPVLLTGSQVPLAETRNDARDNLLTALQILGAHHARLAEVFVCFGGTLLRGNRTTKVDADAFAAFASPKFPPVGRAGIHLEIDWRLVTSPGPRGRGEALRVVELGRATVASLRLFPGIKAEQVANILAPPVEGVVLECFGSGNAPARNRGFIAALRAATARGVVIVAVTQPLRGTADLGLYATGRALLEAGVVSGYDMTAEAALAKLFYLFAKGHAPGRVRELMQRSLRGELTPPAGAERARQAPIGRLGSLD